MSNSSLVNYTKLSPNYGSRNGTKISKITIHHMAGNLSVETCGSVFARSSAQASSNYGVGTDGRVGMYVEEKNRAWTSSNATNDRMAVTIEVANDQIGGNWHVSDKALAKTIDLCVDICKRNGIKKLNYTGDTSGNLTMHCWFAATACPGPYLKSKFKYIADQVNKKLGTTTTTTTTSTKTTSTTTSTTTSKTPYRVQVTITNLNIRKGPGTNYARTGNCPPGVYTITETKTGTGSTKGWGKLKSGAGWIALDYAKKI